MPDPARAAAVAAPSLRMRTPAATNGSRATRTRTPRNGSTRRDGSGRDCDSDRRLELFRTSRLTALPSKRGSLRPRRGSRASPRGLRRAPSPRPHASVSIAACTASISGTSISTPTLVGFCGPTNVRMSVTPRGPKNSLRLDEASQWSLVLHVVIAKTVGIALPSDQMAAHLRTGPRQPMPPRPGVPNDGRRSAGRAYCRPRVSPGYRQPCSDRGDIPGDAARMRECAGMSLDGARPPAPCRRRRTTRATASCRQP